MSWIQLASGAGLPAGYGLVLRGLTAIRSGQASIPDSDDIDQIYRYNTGLAQGPGVLLAAVLGWRERRFFAAEAGDAARSDKTPGTTT